MQTGHETTVRDNQTITSVAITIVSSAVLFPFGVSQYKPI